MNSLNNDPNQILNQNNFKSYDIGNRFYQYYRIPNNASVNPDFAPLHNAYGPNQLLATQFSFQYSDNQGLGDGLTTNSHHNIWNGTPINATISPNSRGNQPQTIDHNSAHFFSIPAHGTPQAADQNLFYQYGYNAPNNMYWTHPSLLEYKSNNQNYTLPHTDKSQSWSDALFNNQYPLFSNSINCKSNVSPFDQTNNTLAMNNVETGYQKHLAQNKYQFSKINSTGAEISPRTATVERIPGEKTENSVNQDKNFSTVSSSNNIYLQIDSIQSQLSNDCSINKDNSNSETNRISTNNSNQQEYSSALLSKHLSTSNTDRGNNSEFWNQDVNRESKLNNNKSYAKVTKLSSRNSNGYNMSNQSSFTQPYINNGISTNPKFNYKSVMNGFATGHSRQIANNNNHQNWFNSTLVNGNSWNTTTKAKWPQDSIRKCVTNSVAEPNMKSNWASKVTFTNTEENIRNAENKIKEIQAQINPIRLDINFEKTRYFVIKSYSEDDIHRSIKYNVWCSTKEGNKRLNDAFQNAQKIGGHVLLFFSVNGSGHFCGIAEMTSVVDENVITGIWCQDKWRGKFSVRWIYVKDVPNTQLRHISTKVKNSKSGSESTVEIKPITNLRDATELKSDRGPTTSFKDDPGYQALKIIIDCKSNMSIFDDFLHYENRELLGIES